jgi:cytochrome c oxidase cbb3-type subunit 4
MLNYESLANFAQTWGTVGFVALFVVALVYALNPRNRGKFDDASRVPLEKD